MNDIAIKVENLSKRYFVGHQATKNERYTSLRDVLASNTKSFLRKSKDLFTDKPVVKGNEVEEFWALKDINFEIKQGDRIGIIGRNGAGKSTLLKILSRITKPTSGRVTMKGRVASLLEVGTGFHPELTGRENIFLNGAILGMSRKEIQRKFDEIVNFAEVERFLDLPVKRYSSGMYVRLAFAIAANLNSEILFIDEVLAVGDIEFQRKCLNKMDEVAASGRTILFVSHHMPSIQKLCLNSIFLQDGKIIKMAKTEEVMMSYLEKISNHNSYFRLDSIPSAMRRGNGLAKFSKVIISSFDDRSTDKIRFGEPIKLQFTICAEAEIRNCTFGFSFVSFSGVEIMGSTAHDGGIETSLEKGFSKFECLIDPMVLCPGRYFIRGAIFRHEEVYDHVDEMLSFEVLNVAFNPNEAPRNHMIGLIYAPYKWTRL